MPLMFILVLTNTRESQGREESIFKERAHGFQWASIIGFVRALILGPVLQSLKTQ